MASVLPSATVATASFLGVLVLDPVRTARNVAVLRQNDGIGLINVLENEALIDLLMNNLEISSGRTCLTSVVWKALATKR